jgi:type VI secretion system protein ImpH
MVAKARTTTDTVAFLQALEDAPHEFDFFAVLRRLECIYAELPRLGEGARPGDEPVRLTQEPSLAFAPATLATFRVGADGSPHRLAEYFFGLFGPHGPLPLHLTEYVRDREHNNGDPTLRRFTDIFHHRMLLLFYRAWANADPAASFDRRSSRRFDAYVGSVCGLGTPPLAERDAVPDEAKYHLAALLGLGTRPASGLRAVLEAFIRLPFRINEFVGAWIKLAVDDRSRLGRHPDVSTLGINIVAGGAVWSCQHRFRLVCGPLTFADFKRLLPGRPSLGKVRDLVRNYVGDELDWDLNLILFANDVPALELGVAGELGWTSWLGTRRSSADADDVVVNPVASANV